LQLPLHTWGGRRAGAGRKRASARATSVPHVARPEHMGRHPVHVTLRGTRRLPSLRKQSVFMEMRRSFGGASRGGFRVVHFSVQTDHVHLIVEAMDKVALSRGTAGLSIRLARAVNRSLQRSGRVWSDRYHARALRTPREVRYGLVYVLMNWQKHVATARGADPCSSAFWFDGWNTRRGFARPPSRTAEQGAPVVQAKTWLASQGWRRLGLVRLTERPKFS
jgi:putative transposase